MLSLLQQLPRQAQFAFLLGIAFMGYVAWQQSFFWTHREDYSFGFLVPFFVAYVLYERWGVIFAYLTGRAAESADTNFARLLKPGASTTWISIGEVLAGLVVLGSLGLLLLGAFHRGVSGPHDRGVFAVSLGLAGFILSTAFIIGGEDAKGRSYRLSSRWRFALIFLFPALIWLVSSPMLYGLEQTVKLTLLNKVTIVVFHVFDFLQVPIIQEGNVLVLGPENRVGVEDACSGIRSLTACIFAGSFLAAVFLDKFWKKLLMVLAAMFLAFFTNILRSLFLTYWAYSHGPGAINEDFWGNPHFLRDANGDPVLDSAGENVVNPDLVLGSVHDVTGYAVLGLTCIGLLLLLPIFNYKLPEHFDDEESTGATTDGESGQSAKTNPPHTA